MDPDFEEWFAEKQAESRKQFEEVMENVRLIPEMNKILSKYIEKYINSKKQVE